MIVLWLLKIIKIEKQLLICIIMMIKSWILKWAIDAIHISNYETDRCSAVYILCLFMLSMYICISDRYVDM